jgi:hypothetical protein
MSPYCRHYESAHCNILSIIIYPTPSTRLFKPHYPLRYLSFLFLVLYVHSPTTDLAYLTTYTHIPSTAISRPNHVIHLSQLRPHFLHQSYLHLPHTSLRQQESIQAALQLHLTHPCPSVHAKATTIGHITQYLLQRTFLKHHAILSLALVILFVQYLDAFYGINAAYLTVMANAFAIFENIALFKSICKAIVGRVNEDKVKLASSVIHIRYAIDMCRLLFALFSAAVLPEATHVNYLFMSFNDKGHYIYW